MVDSKEPSAWKFNQYRKIICTLRWIYSNYDVIQWCVFEDARLCQRWQKEWICYRIDYDVKFDGVVKTREAWISFIFDVDSEQDARKQHMTRTAKLYALWCNLS